MTPVPFDLPLRADEAALLAGVVFEQIHGRTLTPDLRARLAGRAATLPLHSLRPHLASLDADPVHPAACYLAVDGLSAAHPTPLLLHIAPAAAPASALFPKSTLIGRMRPAAGDELIVNAIAFGPADAAHIESFARRVNPAFLPRPAGLNPVLRAQLAGPAVSAPAAFRAFTSILKSTHRNLAAFDVAAGPAPFWQVVWAAIRSGFRHGYTLGGRFSPDTATLSSFFQADLASLESVARHARAARAGSSFDLEADLSACPPDAIVSALTDLAALAIPVQSVLLPPSACDEQTCRAVIALGALPAVPAHTRPHTRAIQVVPLDGPDAEALLAADPAAS